jgi:hypothetical protein
MSYLGKQGAIPKPTRKTRKTGKGVDSRAKGKKECSIQSDCERLLNTEHIEYIRIPDEIYSFFNSGFVWSIVSRTQLSGFFQNVKKCISKYFTSIPDLTILLDDGRFICVELKTSTGTQSQGQVKFEKRVGSKNYYVVRSVEGLKEVLQKYEVL